MKVRYYRKDIPLPLKIDHVYKVQAIEGNYLRIDVAGDGPRIYPLSAFTFVEAEGIAQYDVVRLVDGREGTVIEIYYHPEVGFGYEIEWPTPDGEHLYDQETVSRDMIAVIIQ